MKTTNISIWFGLASMLVASFCPKASAASAVERLFFKEGKVWTVQAGKTALLEKEVDLPNNITVYTNGTFQVGGHVPRAFAEGQVLDADGMLISPNGRIDTVVDHLILATNKTVSAVNGEASTVNGDIQLGKDTWITADRVLLGGEHGWMRVIEGQMFTPDGNTIPAGDTITLQHGKIIVQKEGTQIVIGNGRSIMMNEGTKVFGDGKVVSRDGQLSQLTEGQIITVQGVVKLR